MDDPITWWRGLTRPWRVFFVAFPISLILLANWLTSGLAGFLFGVGSAALWAAGAASLVRLIERMRNPSGRP